MKLIDLFEYNLSDRQKRNALDTKATIIVTMPPEMFLKLTIHPDDWNEVQRRTKSKKDYQTWIDTGNIIVHPFIYVDEKTGQIKGHEGRARALAAQKAGDKQYEVAITIYPQSRNLSVKNIPAIWTGQYDKTYKINFQQEVQKGVIKVLDDNVQKQYQTPEYIHTEAVVNPKTFEYKELAAFWFNTQTNQKIDVSRANREIHTTVVWKNPEKFGLSKKDIAPPDVKLHGGFPIADDMVDYDYKIIKLMVDKHWVRGDLTNYGLDITAGNILDVRKTLSKMLKEYSFDKCHIVIFDVALGDKSPHFKLTDEDQIHQFIRTGRTTVREAWEKLSNKQNIEPKISNVEFKDEIRTLYGIGSIHGKKWISSDGWIEANLHGKRIGFIRIFQDDDRLGILNIWVDEKYRRENIALSLLSKLKQKFPNHEIDFMETTALGKMLKEAAPVRKYSGEKDVPGTVYLIHLDKPLAHSQHYLGWTNDLETRSNDHKTGQGSPFLRAAKEAGINFEVVRTWDNVDRHFERKLKNMKKARMLCPICNPKKSITESEQAAFKNWFGNSKVVDKDGKPLKVYHGSHTDFSEFDRHYATNKFKRDAQRPDAVGLWFTTDPNSASNYGSVVYPAYLSIKNPLVLSGSELNPQEASKQLWSLIKQAGGADAFRKELTASGHDGILINGDYLDHMPGDIWLALNPNQVKSIHNKGSYKVDHPDILETKR